jgi:NB-ARC domain
VDQQGVATSEGLTSHDTQRTVGRGDLAGAAGVGGLGRPADRSERDAPTVRLAELPPEPPDFVGRYPELGRLLGLVPAGSRALVTVPDVIAGPAGATSVCVLSGPAGFGKTALALQAAYRFAGDFPDGARFVELGRDPNAAVRRPWGRMLLVLDDVWHPAQVARLIPSGPGCLVLITSRRPMAPDLGAHPLPLTELPLADAYALFCRAAGLSCGASVGTVEQIVDLCAGSPLAIRLVAGVLRRHSGCPGQLAAQLCAVAMPTDQFDQAERGLAAAVVLAYHALDSESRRLLRLLGVAPRHDITPSTAAALLDMPPTAASRLLRHLAAANLIEARRSNHYNLAAAVRWYAAHMATVADPPATRCAAVARLEEMTSRFRAPATDRRSGQPAPGHAAPRPVGGASARVTAVAGQRS